MCGGVWCGNKILYGGTTGIIKMSEIYIDVLQPTHAQGSNNTCM